MHRDQRPRGSANLPGHLARLTLFKQVPRRLVPCLVKWLTFWFNQHPRLPDELDHYQKCTGSAMSLTCQNQTHLLIYLLHSPWEQCAGFRLPVLGALLDLDEPQRSFYLQLASHWKHIMVVWRRKTNTAFLPPVFWTPPHNLISVENNSTRVF